MRMIGRKAYYTIEEAARFGGVSVRTLRRWLSAGQLSDFLFPFRINSTESHSNELLYRLEPPEEGETRNKRGEWTLGGGMTHESVSGT